MIAFVHFPLFVLRLTYRFRADKTLTRGFFFLFVFMAATNLSDNNPAMATGVHHSRHSGQNISSPKSRRSPRPVSSPWTQIVRGELEIPAVVPSSPSNVTSSAAIVEPRSPSPSSSPSSSLTVEEPAGAERSDSGNESLSNAGNKPAWNKLSNGAVEVGPVMGAVSWPALSESTRFTNKSSSDSPKDSADGSAGPACEVLTFHFVT